jgi:chemotaxis protein CheD
VTEKYKQASIGRIVASSDVDEVLVVYGLGSCVAVCMYDPHIRAGAILHALLPTNLYHTVNSQSTLTTKYVDQGIPLLLEVLLSLGSERNQLLTYLCGGAKLIKIPEYQHTLNVGRRNVEMAYTVLQQQGLDIQAQVVGGERGRTIKLYVADGRITVKTLGQAERPLLRTK